MARGKAKGKDASSMSGKCTMGAGGVTVLMGLIGVIMAAASIKLTYDTDKINKCKDKVVSSCSRRSLSDVSVNSEWTDDFFSAIGVPEYRKLFGSLDSSSASVAAAVGMWGGCGSVDELCSVNTDGKKENKAKNSIDCKATCQSSDYNTCTANAMDDEACYGVVRAKDARSDSDKSCCAGICGNYQNTLKKAHCSAESGVYTETCYCEMKAPSTLGDGACDTASKDTFQETERKDATGKKVGTTKCKWTSGSSMLESGNCGFTQEQLCGGMEDATVTQVIGSISQYAIIAGLIAAAGVIPAIIGAVAKLKGNEQLETMCGMVGAFSTLCCGFVVAGGISAYLFVIGGFLGVMCTQWKGTMEQYSEVSASCNEECHSALTSVMDSFCNLGSGISSTSTVCLLASMCGLITAIYSCIGFCNRRKQQTQVVIIQQGGAAPVAQAQVVQAQVVPVGGVEKPPEV